MHINSVPSCKATWTRDNSESVLTNNAGFQIHTDGNYGLRKYLLFIILFKVNKLLIPILLAIQVSFLTDSSVVQRRRPGMDGRLMVMVLWMGRVFESSPSASLFPFFSFYALSLTRLVYLFNRKPSLVQIQFENAALLPVVALCQ